MQDDELQFKIGDQVNLKTGGPTMVITSLPINPEGIYCKWFNSNNYLQEWSDNPYSLQPEVLKIVDRVDSNQRSIVVGDVVKLGTNGPSLIVNLLYSYYGVPSAVCIWSPDGVILVQEILPVRALRLVR